jgi:hypothetical protein
MRGWGIAALILVMTIQPVLAEDAAHGTGLAPGRPAGVKIASSEDDEAPILIGVVAAGLLGGALVVAKRGHTSAVATSGTTS